MKGILKKKVQNCVCWTLTKEIQSYYMDVQTEKSCVCVRACVLEKHMFLVVYEMNCAILG